MLCQHLIYDNKLKAKRNCKCKPTSNGYCKRHQKFVPAIQLLDDITQRLGQINFPNSNDEKWEDAPLANRNSSYSLIKIEPHHQSFKNMQKYIVDNYTENFRSTNKKIELISMERRQHPLEYYEYYHKKSSLHLKIKMLMKELAFTVVTEKS